jgi:hypothetical protein
VKASPAEIHRRRERRQARRRRRLRRGDRAAAAERMERKVARGQHLFGALFAQVLDQSRPRQKALDKEAASRRKRRARQRKRGEWR